MRCAVCSIPVRDELEYVSGCKYVDIPLLDHVSLE